MVNATQSAARIPMTFFITSSGLTIGRGDSLRPPQRSPDRRHQPRNQAPLVYEPNCCASHEAHLLALLFLGVLFCVLVAVLGFLGLRLFRLRGGRLVGHASPL